MESTDAERKTIEEKFHNFLGEHNNQICFVTSYKDELKTFEVEIFSRINGLNSKKYFTRYFGSDNMKGFEDLGIFCKKNNVGLVKY